MTNIKLKYPFTCTVDISEQLDKTYSFQSSQFLPDVMNDTADIIIILKNESSESSIFNHVFDQIIEDISIYAKINVYLKDDNGETIHTHHELGINIERPFKKR